MNSGASSKAEHWDVGPIAILIAGLMFMESLDASVIPTAAPTIARAFHVTSSQMGICMTAYLATVLVLIPVSAWLVEKWGVRPVLFSAIVLFTTASVLCAVSTSLPELTLMRVLQGAGGAMMVPVGRFIVLRSTDKANIIRAISYLTWPALFAPVIAPALSGYLITYASWPWIFLINMPLGIVALVIAFRIIPAGDHGNAGKLDWVGFYGTVLSLGALVIGAAELGKPHASSIVTFILLVVAVGAGVPTVRHMLRVQSPLVGLGALSIRTFRSASAGGGLFRIAVNAVPFLLPLLFQDKFGWSPARTGTIVLFLFLGNVGFKPLTTPILKRFRFRSVLIISGIISALSIDALVAMRSTTSVVVIAGVLIVSGSFRSLGYTCYNTITFADIEQPMMREANSLANMIQQLTNVFAVVCAVISMKVGASLLGSSQQFSFAFWVVIAFMLLAVVGAVRLPRTAGDSIR